MITYRPGSVTFNMPAYVNQMLAGAGMEACHPSATPLPVDFTLSKLDVPATDAERTEVTTTVNRMLNRTFTTYGATVVIGKPMAYNDLPKDPREAINAVAAEIQKLLTIAEKA